MAPAKPNRNKGSSSRVLGLDVLRFLAIALVVFRHAEPFQNPTGTWDAHLKTVSQFLVNGGWVGVDIFFVLSGFLVSGLLFREWQQRRTTSVGRFLLRRGFKIYPAFWVFIGIYVCLLLIQNHGLDLRGLFGELLFLQNYWGSLCNHTWSLAVEEHFYLMLAGLIWVLSHFRGRGRNEAERNPFDFIPLLFLLTACSCLVFRIASNLAFPPTRVKLLFFCTHIRIDSLFFGVLLSYLWHFRFTSRHHELLRKMRLPLVLFGAVLFIPMFLKDPFQATWIRVWGFILCYIGGGALLLGSLKIFEDVTSKPARFLGYLGANSYSVYLWHVVAVSLAGVVVSQENKSASTWILYLVLCHVGAWGIGVSLARLIEAPVLRIRDRFFPSLATTRLVAAIPQAEAQPESVETVPQTLSRPLSNSESCPSN